MKTLTKVLQATVPSSSAGLMKGLVLSVFLVSLIFLTSCANLIDAARKGDTAGVNALLNKGADVNAKDKNGWTALMEASWKGHTETVKALIDKGADVNAKNKRGDTVLIVASGKGHTETVKALLDKGADVNAKNNYGRTALMWASGKGHTETVKALIEKGADVNAKTDSGRTVLMWASEEGHTETVKALIEKGADVNAKTDSGRTVLMLASEEGHTDIVQLLRQTAGEKKRERVEQDAISKLKSYLPNVTTEEKFFSDGWNSEDLFHDRVGILNMSRNRDILEVTLGFAEGVNAPKAGSDAQQLLDFAMQYSKFDPNVPTNVKLNIDQSIKLCIMRFEHGLLTSVRWLK